MHRDAHELPPEELEAFRQAAREEESDPEVSADAERCWERDCAVPLAHLRAAHIFDMARIINGLKDARQASGKSILDVSRASGIPPQVLEAVESGDWKYPSPLLIQRYAVSLDLMVITGFARPKPIGETVTHSRGAGPLE